MNFSRRIRPTTGHARAVLLGALCAVLGVPAAATRAAQPTSAPTPASSPASAPADWFAGLTRGYGVDDQSEAAVFARLYPELASADRGVREATPRTIFNCLFSTNQPAALKLPKMQLFTDVFTDASRRAYAASRPRDPWLLVPDERKVRVATIGARRAGSSICLDIEELPLDAEFANDAEIDRSVRTIARVVGWVRDQDPNVRLFFYAHLPLTRNYEGNAAYTLATTRPGTPGYDGWQRARPEVERKHALWLRANERLRRAPDDARTLALAELFDGVSPSLYLYTNANLPDPAISVAAFARAHLNEARKYGKPVYPFVWPMMADSDQPVDLRLWCVLLREAARHGDGAVLWDGWGSVWNARTALRVRLAQQIAERRGAVTDAELHAAVKGEFPDERELDALAGPATRPAMPPAPRPAAQPTP